MENKGKIKEDRKENFISELRAAFESKLTRRNKLKLCNLRSVRVGMDYEANVGSGISLFITFYFKVNEFLQSIELIKLSLIKCL